MIQKSTATGVSVPINYLFSIDRWLKGFLLLVVFVLPFQNLPRTFINEANMPILSYLRYLDEGSFVVSLVLLLAFIVPKRASYKKIAQLPFTKFILFFYFIALLSIFVNKVRLVQGLFGTYDLTKNILVLYVFTLLKFTKRDLMKTIQVLQKITLMICLVAIVAEIIALTAGIEATYFVLNKGKRFGLYRIYSLTGTGTTNYLGVYLSLVFYLSLVTLKPSWKKVTFCLAVLSTLFLTFSRQAWVGFGLMGMFFKKKLIPVGVLVLLIVAWMFKAQIPTRIIPKHYFRSYAFVESIKLLLSHPLLGVGPGMFGGITAVIFGTPYYNHWPMNFHELLLEIRTIDLFWPALWGELGIIGSFFYVSIWASIYLYLGKLERYFQRENDELMYKTGRVLRCFIIALVVMGFAGGLNSAFVVFTYFALVGMYISVHQRENNNLTGSPSHEKE